MELTPTMILNLALLIVPPVALVLAFWQRLAQHIRWTVALTALCDVLLFWDELFCRVRDKPYGYSLPKERNVRLSPHSAHVSITHNIPFARLDWNS